MRTIEDLYHVKLAIAHFGLLQYKDSHCCTLHIFHVSYSNENFYITLILLIFLLERIQTCMVEDSGDDKVEFNLLEAVEEIKQRLLGRKRHFRGAEKGEVATDLVQTNYRNSRFLD